MDSALKFSIERFLINICMSTEYTQWTVDRIINTPPVNSEKLHVMDIENFMHPELYQKVQQCVPNEPKACISL